MSETPPTTRPRVPRGIWALGFVSMFMDVSSEMIHSLLPVFLVTVLGAGTLTVGVVEGVGEATASLMKLPSGWLSDRLRARKGLTAAGYALSALTKPLFALALTPVWVVVGRIVDRAGKGIRGAPRDALIGDLVPASLRGTAYGLRQSLDTVGAVLGPLLAMVLMFLLADDFRLVFWIAAIPAAVAVATLMLGVREPPRTDDDRKTKRLRWSDVGRLQGAYWAVVVVGGILTLARFSDAFLILRVQNAGLHPALVPLALVVMNVVYAAAVYPVGALSDRVGRKGMLSAGFVVLIAADVVLALAPGLWTVLIGIGLWGLHLGLTQGLLAASVADAAPQELRGTAFGLFNLVSGLVLLGANLLAGFLWQSMGPATTFLAGAAFTGVGLLATLAVPGWWKPGRSEAP